MKPGDIDECFAKQAIELARQAHVAGNHPFGALLVLDGRVVLTALNTVGTDRDPTAHAESNLVAVGNAPPISAITSSALGVANLRKFRDPAVRAAHVPEWTGKV